MLLTLSQDHALGIRSRADSSQAAITGETKKIMGLCADRGQIQDRQGTPCEYRSW